MSKNNKGTLSQQEYFDNIRNRFDHLSDKADAEISEALSANDNRTNYEDEFASKFHKPYIEAFKRFPRSGVESNPSFSYNSINEKGVSTTIRYFSNRHQYNIYNDYPAAENGPSTRNVNIYLGEDRIVTQGTDYCTAEEEDYEGMGEKQKDEVTEYSRNHIEILVNNATP